VVQESVLRFEPKNLHPGQYFVVCRLPVNQYDALAGLVKVFDCRFSGVGRASRAVRRRINLICRYNQPCRGQSLERRGWRTTLTDKNDEKAQGGSETRTRGFRRLRELTDEELKKSMTFAQEQEAAHDEWERKAILRAYQRSMVWVSRDGVEQLLAAPPHDYEAPRISPDARQVAVSVKGEICLYDLSRETLTQLTHQGNKEGSNRPVWTPDGKRIVFCSDKEGSTNIYWQLADGSGGLERLTTSESTNVPMSVSPDMVLRRNKPDIHPLAARGATRLFSWRKD
jgi:hypothetical protein